MGQPAMCLQVRTLEQVSIRCWVVSYKFWFHLNYVALLGCGNSFGIWSVVLLRQNLANPWLWHHMSFCFPCHVLLIKFLKWKMSNLFFAALKISKWSHSDLMMRPHKMRLLWGRYVLTDWCHHDLIDFSYHDIMDLMGWDRSEIAVRSYFWLG